MINKKIHTKNRQIYYKNIIKIYKIIFQKLINIILKENYKKLADLASIQNKLNNQIDLDSIFEEEKKIDDMYSFVLESDN